MALFTLKITDNVETVDFLLDPYYLLDGGFDIGLPEEEVSLAMLHKDFYMPVGSRKSVRQATISFAIQAPTRTAIIDALQKIERILDNIANQETMTDGARGELQYTWDGATQVTYFEIYSGSIAFPQDVMSVAKIHYQRDGEYFLPEIQLTMQLSHYGYGVSIYTDPTGTTYEIPLATTAGATSGSTGGVTWQAPFDSNRNWVKIPAASVPGSSPYITKLQITNTTMTFNHLYIGHRLSPQPTKLKFENNDSAADHNLGSDTADVAASNDSYRTVSGANAAVIYNSNVGWLMDNTTLGRFYGFIKSYLNDFPTSTSYFAIGYDDYVKYGIRYVSEYVKPTNENSLVLPLGMIQLPPGPKEFTKFQTMDNSLKVGVFTAHSAAWSYILDFMYLLPIDQGLRIWRVRQSGSPTFGSMVDDDWQGINYVNYGANAAIPFFTMLNPIRLKANKDQYLYFMPVATGNYTASMSVRMWGIPTFKTLAM